MKLLLILLTLFSIAGAIEPFTYYWTINLDGDTATVVKWKYNNDSVLVWADKVCDTINILPRWNLFSNHDSTFKWMNIDTIGGYTYMYTVDAELIKSDSIYTPDLQANKANIDTVIGTTYFEDTIRLGESMRMGAQNFGYNGSSITGISFNINDIPYIYNRTLPTYGARISMYLRDTSSYAQGKGGGLAFSGKYNAAGTYAEYAAISGTKANGVDGSIKGKLSFQVTTTASLQECANIDSSGDFNITNNLNVSGYTTSDSISTNGTNFFTYLDTTFYDSLFENNGYTGVRRECRIVQVGNSITFYQDSISYSLSGGYTVDIRGVPDKFHPSKLTTTYARLYNAGIPEPGYIWFDFWGNKEFSIVLESGSFSAGKGGIFRSNISWIIE